MVEYHILLLLICTLLHIFHNSEIRRHLSILALYHNLIDRFFLCLRGMQNNSANTITNILSLIIWGTWKAGVSEESGWGISF